MRLVLIALIIVPWINSIDLTVLTFLSSSSRMWLLAVSNLLVSCQTSHNILISDTLRMDSVIDHATVLDSVDMISCAALIFLDRVRVVIHIMGTNTAYMRVTLQSTVAE